MRPGEKDRQLVLKDRGAAREAAPTSERTSRFGDAVTRISSLAAQPIEMRRVRRSMRAAWAAEHAGISVSPAVMSPADAPLLDASRSAAALPLIAPRFAPRRRARPVPARGPGLDVAAARLRPRHEPRGGRHHDADARRDPASSSHSSLFAFPLVVVAMLFMRGMYRRRVRLMVLDAAVPVVGAVSVAAMVVLAWEVFIHGDATIGPYVGRTWALALLLVGGGRAALTLVQRRARAIGLVGKPTLIVGAGQVGAQVARRLEEHPEYGLRPVGFLDADPPDRRPGRRPARAGARLARRARRGRRPDRRRARDLRLLVGAGPRPDPAHAPLRGARARGLARAAVLRVDQRPRGARAARRPAAARPARRRPEGLAVPAQVRARPPARAARAARRVADHAGSPRSP